MNKLRNISPLPVISLLILGIGFQSRDHWRMQLMLGVTLILSHFANELRVKTHWSAALAFIVPALSAAYYTFSPVSPYHDYGFCDQAAFDAVSAQSLVFLLSVTVFVFLLEDLEVWIQAFCFIAFVSSGWMILHFLTDYSPVGILDNHAMDATFIACVLPLIFSRTEKYPKDLEYKIIRASLLLVPIAAILISGSNTGIVIMFSEAVLWLMLRAKNWKWAVGVGVFGVIISGLGSYLILGWKFANTGGRVGIWRMSAAFWLSLEKYWFGTGSGTYRILGPQIQRVNNYPVIAIWAHSDVLQITFEQGVVGLVTCLLLFYYMLSGSWRERSLFITVLAVGASTLVQMPLRHLPFALFCALICRASLVSFKDV